MQPHAYLRNRPLAAKGESAIYRKRKEVSYPFLKGLQDPETGEPVHRASSVFREIVEVMGRINIGLIRGYGHPVVAVTAGTALMVVRGEDEIEPGRDVFGKRVGTVQGEKLSSLRAGDGVDLHVDGSLTARTFGYVSVVDGFLSVVSPIWISQDRIEAYFINPPQLGDPKVPDPEEILSMLGELRISIGINREAIIQMCRDLKQGDLRESCVRIARGEPPKLSKGQIVFAFAPLPPAQIEGVREAFQAPDLDRVTAYKAQVQAVHEGTVLAEQAEAGDESGPGRDLFGEILAPPEEVEEQKMYQSGINVRREVEEGLVRFVSDIYGYAGVLDDQILVIPPFWISPDKMEVCFVVLPQEQEPVLPTMPEVEALLEKAHVHYGVDPEAIAGLCKGHPAGAEERAVAVARGTLPDPGQDGRIELLFKEKPDPGRVLEEGRMDFRERDAVPQVQIGDLLARRTFPTPGKPGTDVRGQVVHPPKQDRGLLYGGPNVVSEEKGNEQLFYATGPGWARVVKDTLSVMKRFQYEGDVDYKIGNLQIEGDVEIEGSVKSRFRVEATGDVYIGETVERNARVTAGGNVVVQRGIVAARVKVGGDLYVRFIQDSEVVVGGDLVVRNYVQDSQVQVQRKAMVQGNEGGERQLCLLGGLLTAALEIDAASIGSEYRRQTRVMAGMDPKLEARLEKYRKGLAFSDLRSRRAMRAVGMVIGRADWKKNPAAAIHQVPPGRRAFLTRQLNEIQAMKKLNTSLEHHIGTLEKERTEVAGRARVRVLGKAFQKVVVQIGEVYQMLDKDVSAVIFHLNHERTQVVQELLGAGLEVEDTSSNTGA